MKGFLNFSHYGHPCFIREEYESIHLGEDELQRLEDALNMSFSDVNSAIYYAYSNARYLLYRLESDEIDNELLKGREPWMPFKGGYVHIITGEFVFGIKPNRDSYPCWKKEEPQGRYFDPTSLLQLSGVVGIVGSLLVMLANIIGGKNNDR